MPKRATKGAAGYDFEAAEDVTIPSIWSMQRLAQSIISDFTKPINDAPIEAFEKYEAQINEALAGCVFEDDLLKKLKPILVPTGVKAYMEDDEYLAMFNRSGNPIKLGIVLTNGVGVVDSDYYGNTNNDGHIMFQFVNFGIHPVRIKKGDRIGQGIFQKFMLADDDIAGGERTGGHGSTGTA